MSEDVKKRKRSEEDVAELLQRYSAPTILSLLQEVSVFTRKHSDCVKVDWNSLVKNTSTGLCNAREYQMLWRHLAYCSPLLEKIEDGAEPLDVDSDLEFELEAVPVLNPEELAEAKECAKIILSSGSPCIRGSVPRPVVEASLNADIPNDQTSPDPPEKLASPTRGGNMAVPVSSQKRPLPTGPDGNGPGNSGLPAKKKRQLWTKEEDMELIAGVQKCGEGNWTNILKGDFKHNRTTSQLSQRWGLIRKRNGNSNPGNGNKGSSSTRSEERLAANKAFCMAVGAMGPGSIAAKYSGASQMGNCNSSTSSAATSQASRACATQSLNQYQDKGTSSPLIKDRLALKKPAIPGKLLVGPNHRIQAAALAAGGRIANPSTAASLFKAAQSKNAVHIRPGGGSLPISSSMANKPSSPSNTSGPQSTPRSHQVQPLSTRPSPASFSTTLSSQRSSQPPSPPLTSCTTSSNLSSQLTSSESKLEAVQGPKLLEIAERKSSIGSDTSDSDVQEILTEEVGGAADETGSADAATKAGDTSSSLLNKSQAVVAKGDQLQKEATPDQALVDDIGGPQIPAKESTVCGNAEDGSSGSQSLGNKQLEGVEAAADEVKDSCPENSTATDSKSLGNKQLGGVEVAADEVKDSCPENSTTTDSKSLADGQHAC